VVPLSISNSDFWSILTHKGSAGHVNASQLQSLIDAKENRGVSSVEEECRIVEEECRV
jgi:hypothetical protein